MEVLILKMFNKLKESQLFTKKGYYGALAICLAMVGIGCFGSYKKTTNELHEQLKSVTDKPITTLHDETVDVIEKKKGIKKETPVTTVPETTQATTQPITTTSDDSAAGHPYTEVQVSNIRRFVIPVNGEIIQDFSEGELVKNQTTGAWQTHNGIDISGNIGDEVRAMTDGTVTDVIEDPLWGVVVTIDHGDGITARYCGLNKGVTVEKNSHVSAQDVIGAIGATADIESSMETHLHLEVIKNDKYLNPIDVINNK